MQFSCKNGLAATLFIAGVAVALFAIVPTSWGDDSGSLRVPMLIKEPSQIARPHEPITFGVPIPRTAAIMDTASLGVFDGVVELSAQFRVLSRWDGVVTDASAPIRWVLVDIQADLAPGESRMVHLTNTGSGNAMQSSLTIDLSDSSYATIDTGAMTVVLARTQGHVFERIVTGDREVLGDPTIQRLRSGVTLVDAEGKEYRAAPADTQFVVEEQGPLRITVRIRSNLVDESGEPLLGGAIRLQHRVHFFANSSVIRVRTQLENNATYGSFGWDGNSPNPDHVLNMASLVFDLPATLAGDRIVQTHEHQQPLATNDTLSVFQGHSLIDSQDESANFQYSIAHNGVAVAAGDRHAGWIDVCDGQSGMTVGMRWFWQNYEKAFRIGTDRISLELWPAGGHYPVGRDPDLGYQFEGGRHKSYEWYIHVHDGAAPAPREWMRRWESPVIGRAAGRWYYETEAMGMTDPGDFVFVDTDDDERMNAASARYNELMRLRSNGIAPDEGREAPRNVIEAKEQRFVMGYDFGGGFDTADWYGWAHFGDCAWGDGYSSNHYDMPGFLMTHFLRTGDRALWDLAEPHVRQASEWGQVWSIDPNYFVASISFYEKTNHGLSPERLRPAASHNWLRRLVLYYWLTGDQTAYDAALFNADGLWRYFYLAFDITEPTSFTFEPGVWSPMAETRFFSWSLENALQVYVMTGDDRWMTMAEDLVRCLLYAYGQTGHINGPGPYSPGGSLMTHYGVEPIMRFHHASTNESLRGQVLDMLRGLIANVYEVDRVPPSGSGASYRPAALINDWAGGPGYEGPEAYDTMYNGFVASTYAYVGRLDQNEAYLNIAHRLWADGVYYPEYYSGFTPDPDDRFTVDYDQYNAWGWSSGAYPGSNEKVFARQTRAGIPYLWVMNRIRDARALLGDGNMDGAVNLADVALFQNCFTGAGALAVPPTCTPMDLNQDESIDHCDWIELSTVICAGCSIR